MFESDFEKRVQINKIIENQLPEFLLSESPKASDFLKQYYISQEYQGGSVDIVENLDQYLKLDNLTSEVVVGSTVLFSDISAATGIVTVTSTKGYPSEYGLFQIDDEIITYTGITTNTFTGCIRGFSGVTNYTSGIGTQTDFINQSQLVFSTSKSSNHTKGSSVKNLSSLFLQEFYKKLKAFLTPGLENNDFSSSINVGNFIKNARSFYQSKGVPESFRILFNVLYGESARVVDLEQFLIKPSSAKYIRREVLVTELVSGGDPNNLVGQTIKKSSDPSTQASVSEVEILTRENKTYYKISLFVGYDERNLIEGKFSISGKTKALETVSIGSSVISVDSTIGFGQTGNIISGNNKIYYTSKSVNQFFGCIGVTENIEQTSDIKSDEVVYGYENGDLSKKIELRLTGVLSKFVALSDISLVDEGENISVKNIGTVIRNPQTKKTNTEIFANSWIYNTRSSYQIDTINGSVLKLLSKIDKSSLKVGDKVDILQRNSNIIVVSNARVEIINTSTNEITLSNIYGFIPTYGLYYDIRRNLNKASSSGSRLQYGNDKIISDVLNVYIDTNKFGYVASNSLPSYTLQKNIISAVIQEANGSYLQGYNTKTLRYSIISFDSSVSFLNGDSVVYKPSNRSIPGLVAGQIYYVKLVGSYPTNQIRIYSSRSFLPGNNWVEFDQLDPGSGTHTFVLEKDQSLNISSKNILKKFSLEQSLSSSKNTPTDQIPSLGLLSNGVEIINPRSEDKIYYGPLSSFDVINSGKDYDIINPPKIEISTSGAGTTAYVVPVLSGNVSSVFVDPQNFDFDKVISVSLTGGNGTGCILKPVVGERYRDLEFDSRDIFFNGGLDFVNETITFKSEHYLSNGDQLVYNQNGNSPIGVGTFKGSNQFNPNSTLVSGSKYYIKSVNNKTIQLYNTLSDYSAGINTVGLTAGTYNGIHKFRTLSKKTLRSVQVLNSGSGYQNRKLYVKSSGISTYNSTITFNNHGFNDGDLVEYLNTGTPVSGLSTSYQYYVIKKDNNAFRLANAGIGTPVTSDYIRKKYATFTSPGSGYHIFKYPDIKVTINVSYGNTFGGNFFLTPVVSGKIIDAYLYESGSGYGSDILNLEKKPLITVKTGKSAELKPIITNGKIVDVQVLSKGSEYYSIPDLKVIGSGSGAILRAVVNNNKITSVIVINAGIGYLKSNTIIEVRPKGSGALFDCRIRSLTLNRQYRDNREYFSNSNGKLTYNILGYYQDLGENIFSDDGSKHSPIIGWAYDGNPIYGPYGYSISNDNTSTIKTLKTGYSLNTSNVYDRPSGFDPGFFIEDYKFDNSGDLDICNGRFTKTPDFPNGIYAYFAGVSISLTTNKLEPQYPYFVGDYYKSPFIEENLLLDQTYDFNSSSLSRNTFPYKVQDPYAGNYFLVESNEVIKQTSTIESVTKGSVDSLEVLNGGDGYKVNDYTIFDDNGSGGNGLKAVVSSIEGKDIFSLNTNLQRYENSVFIWDGNERVQVYQSPYNQLIDKDNVVISGLSSSISALNGTFTVGVRTDIVRLFKGIPSNSYPDGSVEDIYVSQIPNTVSVGSSLQIDNEILSVLNIYPTESCLRVKRYGVAAAHTMGTFVNVFNNRFVINASTPFFDSKLNDKIYFNGIQSVGVGTTAGAASSVNYTVGETTKSVSIPTQTIYLPNHPFKTGQQLTLTKKPTQDSFIVGNGPSGSTFLLPDNFTASSTVYIINKSKDYIGITTSVGLTTNTSGLYFYSNGSNDYEYLLQSNYKQVTGTVDRILTTIITKSNHGLYNGDVINLEVKPNISVGIGISSSVKLIYNSQFNKLLVNPIGFTSSSIDTVNDKITVSNHNLKTGDKILYYSNDQIASGLTTGTYFVYKVDSNNIKLSETYYDITLDSPNVVNIVGIGGSQHYISLINPPIEVIKNSNLVFNLSDSSLYGSKVKIFYDRGIENEFLSTKESDLFNVIGVGTVGLTTTASLTVSHSENIPSKLYYVLEKSGSIVFPDDEVKNYSEITYIGSKYNDSYVVSGIGSTTFNISPKINPERYSYLSSDCDVLSYSTSSENVEGSIKDLRFLSGGFNYKKLPKFVSVSSQNGKNANIIPSSKTVGKIKNVRIVDYGYEYSSDKTLRPDAFVSPILTLSKSDTISKVNVIDGGKNYLKAPNLIVFDPVSNTVVDSSSLSCNAPNSSIFEVNVIAPIYGLNYENQKIVAINNSNGIGINSIVSSASGIVTCTLSTPFGGFRVAPFAVGDKVFVENIEKFTSYGSGFNSSDYNYEFFNVVNYENTDPAKIEFEIINLTTNPGLAKTYQSGYPTIVNKKIYPVFENIQERALFKEGEQLYSDIGSGFYERDLFVTKSRKDFIKIKGTYQVTEGEIVKGKKTGVIATIKDVQLNNSKFEIDYSTSQNYQWENNVGKLNEDTQVTSDNDYYQNLSYSIKSSIEYDKFIDPVNRLVHPSGLKNFADTSVETSVKASVSLGSTTNQTVILDIFDENRVDAINNFDLGLDYDALKNKSKYVKLKNKKLTRYIKCKTNRVLIIDDISSRFSSKGFQDSFVELETIGDSFEKYLIQIINPDTFDTDLKEIVVLSNQKNTLTFEKANVYSKFKIGDIVSELNDEVKTLRFYPVDPYNTDHDIKILKTSFNTDTPTISGSQTIGAVSLTGTNQTVAVGTAKTIASYSLNSFGSLFANVQLLDSVTKKLNYVEVLLGYDGTDTHLAEYYFDDEQTSSQKYIGIFTAITNQTTNTISLQLINQQSNPISVRANIVGFGSTASGIGTYRFKIPNQYDGTERSARLESFVSTGISSLTVCNSSFSLDQSVKSLVRVSCGKTSSLHQVMMINDKKDSYVLSYPYVSIGTTSGIGTFGSENLNDTLSLKFYPDPIYTTPVTVQSYNEILYTLNDFENENPPTSYGSVTQSLFLSAYDGINGNRANKTDFDLKYQGIPIYSKTFDPTNINQIDPATGIFTIKNHFFSNGEELKYIPDSTYAGIGATSVGITTSVNYLGVSTNILPSIVYPIVLNPNQFKIATRKDYAVAGTYVTFTSYGSGNAHRFEMNKKVERTIISLDGIVQQPVTYTSIAHNLQKSVGAASSIISLSGIGTVQPRDVLKIDDEYMKITAVGVGSTSSGPITGSGSFNLVKVIRGSIGSAATSHNSGSIARIYRGSFNIVGSKVYFLDPPKGNTRSIRDNSNLPYVKAEFGGRTFLRQDYSSNILFDDISDRFTGIGKTYTLTSQGINTTGITIGNGILFINGVFQTPTTLNNSGNNYSLIQNAGISSVVFSGITSANGDYVVSPFDINQNQLPRGGLIVSLGSTPGLGYAPLVGASVTAVINPTNGSIVSVGFGSTDILGSGYRGPVSIGITQYIGFAGSSAIITANVGAGGTLSFNVSYGGTGYTKPSIQIPQPSYENLPVVGVSRLGLGQTTDTGVNLLLTVDVGASNTTGIGSTFFQVSSFKISRPGYGFNVGDKFKAVGLVAAKGLSAPLSDFTLEVVETFNDYFSAWQFGELDYIDTVKFLQDGLRKRFPLYYNGNLLSFEIDPTDSISSTIDLNAVLVIFVNGVLQTPGISYQFDGGTSFIFTEPPKANDKIDIFFYLGSRSTDVEDVSVSQIVEIGDSILIEKNPNYSQSVSQESQRKIIEITGSDLVQTDIYVGQGIDETYYRPIKFEKQKVDTIINGDYVYKDRDSIESLIYPTAKVIGDITSSSTQIFVDNAEFFNYEENSYGKTIDSVDALVVAGSDPIAAALTATVSPSGTISNVSINNPGYGYTGSSINLSVSKPKQIGIGIGTTATISANISYGSISSVNIINPGLGYTTPPQILIEIPSYKHEVIQNITYTQGFSGIITGITTATGVGGHPLALKFFFRANSATANDLLSGYPVCIVDTRVGTGVTSVSFSNSSIVGIGTSFLDNIYYVNSISSLASNAEIICNVATSTNISGITTYGSLSSPLGRISWGRLYSFTRSANPISIGVTGLVVDSGLSTFPTIQRRKYGLRSTGAILKSSSTDLI